MLFGTIDSLWVSSRYGCETFFIKILSTRYTPPELQLKPGPSEMRARGVTNLRSGIMLIQPDTGLMNLVWSQAKHRNRMSQSG